MSLIISNNPQGTPEWKADRAGHATSSKFQSGILAKGKAAGSESVGRANYRLQLAVERITGRPDEDGYKNDAMEQGHVFEETVKPLLETRHGLMIDSVGFVKNDRIPGVGCSPDGRIMQLSSSLQRELNVKGPGGVEVKSAVGSTAHAEALENGMPSKYAAQVQGNMWITESEWWLFVSFDPRFPEGIDAYIQLVRRDDAYCRMLDAEVRKFLAEVGVEESRFRELAKSGGSINA